MYNTFLSKVQGAIDKSVNGSSAPAEKGDLVARPLMEQLKLEFRHEAKAVYDNVLMPTFKALGTTDIGSLRLVSVSDRTASVRNEDTVFLNHLESKGNPASITDYQFKIKENDIVTDLASVVNIDSTSIFPTLQTKYGARYNTLTTVGNTLKVSFMASSIASQQADVNMMENEIDAQMNRIRRRFNSMLLDNTEIVAEAPAVVPQMHGFLTASTMNTVNAAGANLSNTLLQNAVNTIASSLGYGHNLVLWITPGQLPIIRDLMINRFPGQSSDSFYNQMSQLRRNQFSNFQIPVQVVYEAYPGGSIPVVVDPQMPANTACMFVSGGNSAVPGPRLARFKMDGQVGPFVLARPEATLYELVACFDIQTLDDPLQVSRIKFTNLAS